jgi:hypothetical protein
MEKPTMQTSLPPTTIRIIQNDYLAYTLVWIPPCLWLLFAAADLLPGWLAAPVPSVDVTVLFGLAAASLFCALALAWRITTVRAIISEGAQVSAEITALWFFSNRGRVKYQYIYQGATYNTQCTLVKNERLRRLVTGDRVTLSVDPADPKRVFLLELYR